MRKDQLKLDVDYAYWDGHGGFAIPRTGHAAEIAFNRTLRVRVLDTDAPVRQEDYLIPPRSKGVLFKVLDRDGHDTHKRVAHNGGPMRDELVTHWQPSARNFAMEWTEFVKLVQPLLDQLAARLGREAALRDAATATRAVIASRLGLDEEAVRVELYEGSYRADEIYENVRIDIDIGDFAALFPPFDIKVPPRPKDYTP